MELLTLYCLLPLQCSKLQAVFDAPAAETSGCIDHGHLERGRHTPVRIVQRGSEGQGGSAEQHSVRSMTSPSDLGHAVVFTTSAQRSQRSRKDFPGAESIMDNNSPFRYHRQRMPWLCISIYVTR